MCAERGLRFPGKHRWTVGCGPEYSRSMLRKAVWPAILVTILTGMGFAGLKFVLIGEIAFDADGALDKNIHALDGTLPWEWMTTILVNAYKRDVLDEAVSQGLAAVLTAGVLCGFLVNSPLSGAWRVGRLFFISSAGVALGTVLCKFVNPWPVAFLVGIFYGTACAARGKAVPLIASASGWSNTLMSGLLNASLVIGLLMGSVLGLTIYDKVETSWYRHLALFTYMLVATGLSLLVTPHESRPIPFRTGLRDLLHGTKVLFRKQWPLLVGGGISWGIASAAALAALIDAIDRLHLIKGHAVSMIIFPAAGAIIGNLCSQWLDRRRWVILCYVALAVVVASYPIIIQPSSEVVALAERLDDQPKELARLVTHAPGYWSTIGIAAPMMVLIGMLFAAPTNVLDARLLAYAAAEGQPGRGSTVMSLIHNVFILLVGASLALALFGGHMTAAGQFYCLAGFALATGVVCLKANISDRHETLVIPDMTSGKFLKQ
jgi:hypothetical protein